jgi:putative peptide zinc metalloprotease protein
MTRQMPPDATGEAARPYPPDPSTDRIPVVDPPTEPIPSVMRTIMPRRTKGLSLLGEYEGGGYDEPRYLVDRGDGQMLLVSRMLYVVLGAVTGDRTLAQVAEAASRDFGKVLTPEAVHYLIEHKLQPRGLATLGGPPEAAPRANPLLGLSLHRVLLPAKVVRFFAAIFHPLFFPPVVAVVLVTLLALDIWLLATGHTDTSIRAAVGSPGLMLVAFAVLLANTLFHECGHAAGCHYGGGKPGAIGVAILIVVPAFYTNVNDAYRLDRRGRLRTDLGGIYFNGIFAVALGALYLVTGFAAIPAIIVVIHLQMLQQLIPLVRLDGYYILGDLVGVPNLFEQIPHVLRNVVLRRPAAPAIAGLRPRVRVIITVWVAVVVPALFAALVNLLVFLPGYLKAAAINMALYWQAGLAGFDHGDAGVIALALISIVVLLVPWVGLTALLLRTVGKVLAMVSRRRERARKKRNAGVPGGEAAGYEQVRAVNAPGNHR